MVDTLDHNFRTHGHRRSLSCKLAPSSSAIESFPLSKAALASSIMPVTSDTSAVTSVTASPIDNDDSPHKTTDLDLSLKDAPSSPKHDANDDGQQPVPASGPSQVEVGADYIQEKQDVREQEPPLQVEPSQDVERGPMEMLKDNPGVSWGTLANLARDDYHQGWRLDRLEKEAKRLRLAKGVNKRLQDTFSIAYGNLIDQFKGDDGAGFAGLYEASERLNSRYGDLDHLYIPPVPEELPRDVSDPPDSPHDPTPVEQLDAGDQNAVLEFLDKLRTDLDYLADLITNLTPTELSSLTSCYHPAGVDLSILPNHSHGRTQLYSRDSQMLKLSRRMDNLDLFHYKDPYFALRYCLFDSSAPSDSLETHLMHEVWARTCAKVMSEGKLGSEEFAIATIDSFVPYPNFGLKEEFESFILTALAEGWFILDPPEEEAVEKAGSTIEPERASHAIAIAEFLDRHTRKLLTLLTNHLDVVLPVEVLRFIHTTLSHIQAPQMRELAKKFIVSRWYFASFLTSLIVYPEVRGMGMNHHIGQSARQNILNRIALQLQSQIFSVLAPSTSITLILPEVQDQVFRIVDYFDPPAKPALPRLEDEDSSITDDRHLMLSTWDIVGLIETLRPTALISSSDSTATPHTLDESGSMPSAHHTQTSDPNTNAEPLSEAASAESSSTDTTYVESGLAESTSHGPVSDDVQASHRHDAVAGEPGLQRLDVVADRLRSLCKAVSRTQSTSPAESWTFFKVQAVDGTLQCSPGRQEIVRQSAATQINGPPDHSSDLHARNGFSAVRNAFKRILKEEVLGVSEDINSDCGSRMQVFADTEAFLQSRISGLMSKHQYLDAGYWNEILKAYNGLCHDVSPVLVLSELCQDLSRSMEIQRTDTQQRSDACEALVRQLDLACNQKRKTLRGLTDLRKELRLKMWYASDVKLSGPYEDALRVTKALRSMVNPKKSKQQGGLASWARQRLRGTSSYDRADRQALEAMCAPKDQGGFAKLGDSQIDMVGRWLTKNNIENLCEGEERIHRFYYEVQKLVNKLTGTSLIESPVLWSSHFFRREKVAFDSRSRHSSFSSLGSPMTPPYRPSDPSISRSPTKGYMPTVSADYRMQPSADFNNSFHISTSSGSHSHHGPYTQPKPVGFSTNYRFADFTPPMTPLSPKPSEGFGGSTQHRLTAVAKAKSDFAEQLKKRLSGLISSDLGYILWALGSETDAWTDKVAAEVEHDAEQTRDHALPTTNVPVQSAAQENDTRLAPTKSTPSESWTADSPNSKSTFHGTNSSLDGSFLSDAYASIFQNFSLSQDPYKKLQWLGQLEELVTRSIQANGSSSSLDPSLPPAESKSPAASGAERPSNGATAIDSAFTKCSQRRTLTLRNSPARLPLPFPSLPSPTSSTATAVTTTTTPDATINSLLSLIRNPNLRPLTLYRDLQAISSIVPSAILDHTPLGRAFWSISMAALTFKKDLVTHTIARATQITEYHLSISAKHPPQVLADEAKVPKWVRDGTLKDAAELWLRAAKEGSVVAARELALFYLTHPDLIARVTAPLAKGRDVFGGAAGKSSAGGGGLDQATFSVVLHWMSIAAEGGDTVAREFLRENGGRDITANAAGGIGLGN